MGRFCRHVLVGFDDLDLFDPHPIIQFLVSELTVRVERTMDDRRHGIPDAPLSVGTHQNCAKVRLAEGPRDRCFVSSASSSA